MNNDWWNKMSLMDPAGSPSLLVCDKWCVLDFRGDIRKAKVVCLCEQIAFIFGSTITDFH